MLLAGLIALIVAAVVFMILWKVIGWSWWLSLIIGVVLGLILGAMLLFWVFPKFSGFFTAAPNAPPVVQPTNAPAPTVTVPIVPPTPITAPNTTGLFGSGSCTINGTTYTLQADPSAIWMDSETLKVLAEYGGHCEVVTIKQGWYWSVGNGTIMHDSVQMERGNALNATTGNWTFTYDAPAAGTTNESLGLTFRDNLPQVETSNDAFGTGTCTVNGQNYSVAFDATAVWEDDELLRQLWQYGGICTVTTVRNGWYWSVAGAITLDGRTMANGQRLVAPAGTYIFVYEEGAEANGFIIRDNVPFGQ